MRYLGSTDHLFSNSTEEQPEREEEVPPMGLEPTT